MPISLSLLPSPTLSQPCHWLICLRSKSSESSSEQAKLYLGAGMPSLSLAENLFVALWLADLSSGRRAASPVLIKLRLRLLASPTISLAENLFVPSDWLICLRSESSESSSAQAQLDLGLAFPLIGWKSVWRPLIGWSASGRRAASRAVSRRSLTGGWHALSLSLVENLFVALWLADLPQVGEQRVEQWAGAAGPGAGAPLSLIGWKSVLSPSDWLICPQVGEQRV